MALLLCRLVALAAEWRRLKREATQTLLGALYRCVEATRLWPRALAVGAAWRRQILAASGRMLGNAWASEPSRPGFKSWLCHSLACEISVSVCLSFLSNTVGVHDCYLTGRWGTLIEHFLGPSKALRVLALLLFLPWEVPGELGTVIVNIWHMKRLKFKEVIELARDHIGFGVLGSGPHR